MTSDSSGSKMGGGTSRDWATATFALTLAHRNLDPWTSHTLEALCPSGPLLHLAGSSQNLPFEEDALVNMTSCLTLTDSPYHVMVGPTEVGIETTMGPNPVG